MPEYIIKAPTVRYQNVKGKDGERAQQSEAQMSHGPLRITKHLARIKWCDPGVSQK